MTHVSVRAVVVDDDFMIARLHGKFIDSQPGYQLVGIAHNYEQALSIVKETNPNLLLLDVFMPDRSGIDVLREIRALNIPCDAILITAANELEVVEEGFRFGVFDYLIKPFDLNHLQDSLKKYGQFKSRLSSLTSVNQGMVDDLKKMRSASHVKPMASGIDFRTLERIKSSLSLSETPQSAEEIAKTAGVSRSTARTYLAYLVEENSADEELVYGAIGRPQRVFRIK
ncbi:response regulator [Aneurinibacillus sp. Ricciae_BoGa-3]|uniref:response regulator n=1 Tax=Aneurinibacillus sp. Ricciae_BoGa-3 TaxID=3022697 RepID=UPI0023404BEA|nr:response regulator [Aneurinibacillus sp. Ricciae_BoGa-3]WCK54079.1 response regulator [Aneurinibacillus sp. Ricciae_BoGa-3]